MFKYPSDLCFSHHLYKYMRLWIVTMYFVLLLFIHCFRVQTTYSIYSISYTSWINIANLSHSVSSILWTERILLQNWRPRWDGMLIFCGEFWLFDDFWRFLGNWTHKPTSDLLFVTPFGLGQWTHCTRSGAVNALLTLT